MPPVSRREAAHTALRRQESSGDPMKEDDKKCNSFSELADFIDRHSIALSEEAGAEPLDFCEAMKDVRKISHKKEVVGPRKSGNAGVRNDREAAGDIARVLRDDRRFNVTNLPEYMEGRAEEIHPLAMEKLRNGEYSVEKILDLHGLAIDVASQAFTEFLSQSVKNGLCCVKVIHGRGLKSRGEPVLKEKLKNWLVRAMNRKWVIAFSSARMCDGGPGATYILLKRRPRKTKMHIIG